MKKRIYHTANGEYPGHRLTFAEKSAHLYHYTSFVSFVKIWLSQRLLFSPLSKMNDVQEKSVRCASSNPNSIPILKAYDEIRRKYKQISFTMDYDSYFKGCMSTIMWGHYADMAFVLNLTHRNYPFQKGHFMGSFITRKQWSIILQFPQV